MTTLFDKSLSEEKTVIPTLVPTEEFSIIWFGVVSMSLVQILENYYHHKYRLRH